MNDSLPSPAPKVALVNAFARPLDNAVATARTCYSSRIVSADDVARDEAARTLRDRIARETYAAGHHTTLQHAAFQFTLENVSRQFVWSFLHAHPFYNSEQVSQRYVEVRPGRVHVPPLPAAEDRLYRAAAARMAECYRDLVEALAEPVATEYGRLFPARRRDPDRWAPTLQKRAQEVARYALPVATHTHLYHTVNGVTLYRYHRLCRQLDVPEETAQVVSAMIEAVRAHDPLFLRNLEAPLETEETLEDALLAPRKAEVGGERARAFAAEFDRSLEGRSSRLIDYKVHAEGTLAAAIRGVVGLTRDQLPDAEAIGAVLSPRQNRYLGERLQLGTLSKAMRALAHPHYSFRKKLSHTADSQDQRHRMVPASRPVLLTQYAGGEPDVVVPRLVAASPRALELFMACMRETFGDIDRLLAAGVQPERALYLLPNAFPIRFEESGDLLGLHHKWTTRLCYCAQEEIWRASREEVEQVRRLHPSIGEHLLPPCGLRAAAGETPFCPEGPRFCGVPVWRLAPEQWDRLL